MLDQGKSKQQLIEELVEVRRRVAALEESLAEQQRKSESFQQTEVRWRSIAANMPVFICLVDCSGTIQYLNHPAPGHTLEDAIGKSVFDFMEPGYREVARECIERVFTTGQAGFYEPVAAGPNGSMSCYETRVGPVKVGDQVTAVTLVSSDISQRKQADEALRKAHDELEQRVRERTAELAKANENLRQSHDELQAIYDNMVDGLLIADCTTGRLLRTNPAVCRMLGDTEEELLSKSIGDIHPTEVVSVILQKFRTQQEGQRIITENRPTLRKDGSVFYADISNIRISYQGRPCVIGLFRDITERKQAQEALRASEERFRVTFEEAPVGMVIGVGDGVITKANRALCRISGYSEDELVGRHIRDLTYPEDRELSSPFVKRLMAGEIPSFTLEKRYLRKDGQPFWAQATTAMAHKPDGKIAFALGVVEDITERKQAQEALQRQHQTLKHLLQSSDHERQLIAYEIHDGLAQELAGAIMQFDAFDHLKNSKPKQAADAYHAGMTMLRQGHSEARRLIAGVRPPILDEEGIAAAIGHLVNEQIRLKGPKIKYHSRVEFDRLDPTLENAIYRIAQEAFTNACTHSKSERISVSLLQRGDHLRIEVRDWGVGFDPKTVPKNHFGLEGIRQRAKLLGGKCSIRSKAGKGTSISVELPVVLRDDEG